MAPSRRFPTPDLNITEPAAKPKPVTKQEDSSSSEESDSSDEETTMQTTTTEGEGFHPNFNPHELASRS